MHPRSPLPALLLGSIVVACALHAEGSPTRVATSSFEGTVKVADDGRLTTWSAWFDAPIADVQARLTSWSDVSSLMENVVSHSATPLDPQAKTARLTLKRRSPAFFIPDPTLVFDAGVAEHDDGTATVTWRLIEGLPKRAERTWKLTPRDGGTLVQHTTHIVLPFEPPAFLLKEPPSETLRKDVEAFRTYVGAKESRATSPAKK